MEDEPIAGEDIEQEETATAEDSSNAVETLRTANRRVLVTW